VLQNIVFALSVKGAFIILGSVGVANMWEAVIADVGVSLLAVMNSLRTIGHKFS
jgi:Cd2+/Zn2+-exporting ATPase